MRIGFDLRPALRKNSRRRGIGKYTYQLVKHLLRANPSCEYVVYGLKGEELPLEGACERKDLFHLRRPSRLNWVPDLFFLPGRIRQDRIDIFHATEITSIPRLRGCAQVWAHVHDLIPLVFWEETLRRVPRDYRLALRWGFGRAATADRIITDSLHSKRDICERLKVAEEKVEVVYPGCSEVFRAVQREEAAQQLARQYGVRDSYVFYVGGSDFRKNLGRLVRAFSKIRRGGYAGKLVMAGETFLWNIGEVQELQREIARMGLEGEVVFPGYVPDEDLPLFYSACDVFVFPSLYEGFGLPVLEAMKCGAPVLASRTSSIPEVGGEAVAYFDPRDEDALVEAFCGAEREEMRSKGFEQAAKFSWESAAEQIDRLYKP